MSARTHILRGCAAMLLLTGTLLGLTACNTGYAGYTEYRAAPPPKSEFDQALEQDERRRLQANITGNGPVADGKPTY